MERIHGSRRRCWPAAAALVLIAAACRGRSSAIDGAADEAAGGIVAPVTGKTVAEASPTAAAVAPAEVATPVADAIPAEVDLRDALTTLGLVPRAQGARGTCSVFTTCAAIEFALAKQRGRAERLSVEFLNWSGSQVIGRPSDGAFFHNALAGFAKFGLCGEAAMPYAKRYHAQHAPSAEALAEAARVRDECRETLAVRWIVPWQPNRFGLDETQFAAVKATLARGFPVAAGSGHSRLLVGYRDDAAVAGGGTFLTEDSALARFDAVTYDFVRTQVADVFWVEALRKPGVAAK